MTFERKDGRVITKLPNGDALEILPTDRGFRVEVSFLDERGIKKLVFCKDYTEKELSGLPTS